MEVQKMGLIFLSVLACVFIGCVVAEEPDSNLIVTRAAREVDLTTSVVKQSVSFTFENKGTKPISSFIYVLDANVASHLAYISAKPKGSETLLSVRSTKIDSQPDLTVFKVTFPSPLTSSETTSVTVKTVFSHVITPYPKEVSQMEKQFVQYTTNAYVSTPYTCSTQNSDFVLATSNIEAYSRVNPVSVDESTVSYGPYSNIEPFSSARISLHYENNGAFLTVLSLDRLIQVSHWGVIQVEEHVHIKQTGAALKGPFSRYDYQRIPNSGPSSVKSYKSLLPAAAQDVYYRDEIGNISTSHLREDEDFVELTLRPRFPLFGGWQTRYYIGYNIPSYEYLFNSGSHFLLRMRFVDHIYDDQVIDEVTTRIILPEGSKNIDLKPPYNVQEDPLTYHFTYLDILGRPVVTARAGNLVEEQIADFELRYDFESYLLLQEPLLLVGGLLLFFWFVIFIVRLDFTISRDSSVTSQEQQSHAKELASNTTMKQFAQVKKIQAAIDVYKKSKDVKTFKSSTGDSMKKYQELYSVLVEQLACIKDTDTSKVLKKVKEIQDGSSRLIDLAVQLVNGQIKPDPYNTENNALKKKLKNLQEEVESMIQRL